MLRSKRKLGLFSAQVGRELDLLGTWVNELGSKMEIENVDAGLITGRYWSRVSDNDETVYGDLTGMVAGDTIGFAVNWQPTFESITSWSGKILVTGQGQPCIYTLWQLSRGVGDNADWWQSFLCGSDTFWLEEP